jgi:catechol 2,3-dioxygenase-like lactoylglutathione lyase family enzyme
MITGTHAIIYAQDAEKARAFFRDVLEWPYVDAHDGWLIFKLPPGEVGIHPTGSAEEPSGGAPIGRICGTYENIGTQFRRRRDRPPRPALGRFRPRTAE